MSRSAACWALFAEEVLDRSDCACDQLPQVSEHLASCHNMVVADPNDLKPADEDCSWVHRLHLSSYLQSLRDLVKNDAFKESDGRYVEKEMQVVEEWLEAHPRGMRSDVRKKLGHLGESVDHCWPRMDDPEAMPTLEEDAPGFWRGKLKKSCAG